MTEYLLHFKVSAAKEFRSLPNTIKQRIANALDLLKLEPRPSGVKKLQHSNLYRIRVGDYRIVYEIDDRDRLIRVTRIRHRREIYRN